MRLRVRGPEYVLAVVLLIGTSTAPLQAQGLGPLPTDSIWGAGYLAGDSLAQVTPVSGAVGRVASGALGGFLMVPGLFMTLGGHPEALLPGAGIVAAGAEIAPARVPALPDSLLLYPSYQAGFEAGFREREAHRRRWMTWGAAGVSAAVTFTAILLLFTNGYT
jgi:hypothetical protein